MARTLAEKITISDADGANEKPYPLLDWSEGGESDDGVEAGAKVRHVRRFWSGMGETTEMGRGGYYYSENAYHGDPFALKLRPTIGTVTLTGNTTPVERFFEALDAASSKYVYALAGAKSFKVKLSDRTLAETKTFTGAPTVFAQGKYTGNGTSKSITGVGFQPAIVVVKGDTAQYPVIKTANMPTTYAKVWNNPWPATAITSLDADGFSVGAHATVNSNGVIYYWQAWKAESGLVATGTYTGNGADDRNINGVGFQPAFVHVMEGAATTVIATRFSTVVGDYTQFLHLDSLVPMADGIQGFNGDGFQVGTHGTVNANGVTYYWVAWRCASGVLATGTYDGDGSDSRAITGLPFQPVYAIINGITPTYSLARRAGHRGNQHTGDSSQVFANLADAANRIQSMDSEGFTVGTDNSTNLAGYTYHYVVFGSGGVTPQVGKSAQWVSAWRVPMGDSADAQTLTTVGAAPTADTWTVNYGLGARHFCVKGNKLARALSKRYVSLCSADDIGNLGNWGAEYPVGPPDCVITDLVEWSDELAVCATDGMYMFDGVATSKQQLPLLGGLKDDDNGKNTLRMASFIFYPSADGFWRWQYGAHKRVDPDADRFYVKAVETTNEPLNLKHYGSAFCGDHVYHACYDGTNYLLLHGKLTEEGELVWDCLLSTTNAIKTVYLDSNRYLWFGYGNNLAYIVLSQGGEADGGNFGQASLVTTIYEREIILAEEADVRLRMVKVITRNMPGATFKWQVFASRDGGTFAQVGSDISTDGVIRCYFTAASNLTARRIRLKYIGTATAGFTPDTTPPEIIFAGVYGEAKPDDAEEIKAVINLDGDRSAETVYTELKARENAGVVKVRHPINNTPTSMIIHRVETTQLRQKAHEEPVAVALVYMRRGDVA